MTSASSNLSKLNNPFVLLPVGKDYLWGGDRLNKEFNQNIPLSPLAESWVCSTLDAGDCEVGSGSFTGQTLKSVLKSNPSFMGRFANETGEIPIMVKLIDTSESLSIQVHPDDEYAAAKENGSLGKKEMWYILDAAPDAFIYRGFRHSMTKRDIEDLSLNGTITKCLNRINVKKDEIYSVEPGCIHGIGGGTLIAEVQENSDITYRLFDYDRTDKNGQKRELHLKKALEVIDTGATEEEGQPLRVLKFMPGCASEVLYRCKYFQTERVLVNSFDSDREVELRALDEAFQILLCIDGSFTMSREDFRLDARKGTCIFLPAGSDIFTLEGKAQFLRIRG